MNKCITVLLILLLSVSVYAGEKNFISFVLSGGINLGNVVSDQTADAVTYATRTGFRYGGHLGVHAEFDVFGQFLETGLDYVYFNQGLIYLDESRGTDGMRTFNLDIISLPVLYNFHFFKKQDGKPGLIVGVGVFGAYLPSHRVMDSGVIILSDYKFKDWIWGGIFRISSYPFIFDKYSMGYIINVYRSLNRLYVDDYHTDFLMGDLAGIDVALSFKF